jgi:hypothetical protein
MRLTILRYRIPQLLLTLALYFVTTCVFAENGGIRGVVKTESGETLPFTTIFVKQTRSGTIANENGSYEIALPPGTYDIAYQFVGYKTEMKSVEVGSGFQTVDVILYPQAKPPCLTPLP